MINFDFNTYGYKFDNNLYLSKKENIINKLNSKNDMSLWMDIDSLANEDLISDMKSVVSYLKSISDVLVVIGIGGSYLGSKAVIDALSPYFSKKVYFVGNSLSSDYLNDLLNELRDKDVALNVISKSGTTLETMLLYNLMMDFMKEKYSESEIKKRVIVTTDKEKGKLRKEVLDKGFESFIMPNNIGGRFSVLTPVGLLPIIYAGIDIDNIFKGARLALENKDAAYRYACIRDSLFKEGKLVENYVVYEPKLNSFVEWLKQLYGESLGKDDKGILPIGMVNTRDLHSLGQFIQDGNKIIFETVFNILNSDSKVYISDFDKNLNEINNISSKATSIAHFEDGVYNNLVNIDYLNPLNIGYLLQFFMMSCTYSAYLDSINPFDQPGVEKYKTVMKTLINEQK